MEVNSVRSARGYPRQISLEPSKASNRPLCFHDFGKIPVCKSQQDLPAPHHSHAGPTMKYKALLPPPFNCKVTPSPGCCYLRVRAYSAARQEWMSSAWACSLLRFRSTFGQHWAVPVNHCLSQTLLLSIWLLSLFIFLSRCCFQ